MARVRPIKLHIKDGKDSTFRLIGPKGRVLSMLQWDGSDLELGDASDVEVVQKSLNIDNLEDSVDELKNEDPQDTSEEVVIPDEISDEELTNEETAGSEELEDIEDSPVEDESTEAYPAVAEQPEPKEDTKDEDVAPESVPDVSGEDETAGLITDDDLSELLEDEQSADTVVARNKKGESETEAVERVQDDHPDADVVFEDPDTPPPAAPEDDTDTNPDSKSDDVEEKKGKE